MAHLQTVQQIYEAFGRGDVPAIQAKLTQDVDWEYGAGLVSGFRHRADTYLQWAAYHG